MMAFFSMSGTDEGMRKPFMRLAQIKALAIIQNEASCSVNDNNHSAVAAQISVSNAFGSSATATLSVLQGEPFPTMPAPTSPIPRVPQKKDICSANAPTSLT